MPKTVIRFILGFMIVVSLACLWMLSSYPDGANTQGVITKGFLIVTVASVVVIFGGRFR
jgi:multisubunit Na+/H+ antiporter MnhB subunit